MDLAVGNGAVSAIVFKENFMTESKLEGRSTVKIELGREEWYQLMIMAHEHDITLNQMVEQILRKVVQEHVEKNPL